MTKRTRRNKVKLDDDKNQVTSTADLGGARQTTESQEERNEINRQLAVNQERQRMQFTESTPSQTATSDELNDADQKREDAAHAAEVATARARRFEDVRATVEANQTPETLAHEVATVRARHDDPQAAKEHAKSLSKTDRKRVEDAEREEQKRDEEVPTTRGVQPVVVTEGNVPQTSINSRTTTVDPRTTTITNRRDGDPPSGEVEQAIRSQSISGRIDFGPAHVPPDQVDRVRGSQRDANARTLGASQQSITGVQYPPVARRHPHAARPLGETSLHEAQGLPHVGEGSASGLVGNVPHWEVERHAAPTQNVSGSKSMHVADSVQQQRAEEAERQRLHQESIEAKRIADEKQERREKVLKSRRAKGKPRAKGNKGKRKTKGGSKH